MTAIPLHPMDERERTALLERHRVAVKLAPDLPPEQRIDLLAAVVWPRAEILRRAA